jgi:hypothetical protein
LLFGWVASPHYLGEISSFVGYAMMSALLPAWGNALGRAPEWQFQPWLGAESMMTLTMGSRVSDTPPYLSDFRCDAQRDGSFPVSPMVRLDSSISGEPSFAANCREPRHVCHGESHVS